MKQKQLSSVKLSIVLFLLLFVVHAVVYMTKNMFSAAMASIVEVGAMTKSQTGLISAVFWLIYGTFQIIGGFAADKYSPFKLVLIGILSGIVSNAVIYCNQSYGVVMTVWCINAALQFGLWPGIFKITTTQIAPAFRQTAIFWVLLSTSTGQAVSLLVASFVSNWVDNFLISAISLGVFLVLWVVIYKLLERKMVEVEVQARDTQAAKDDTDMKSLMQKSGILWVVLISLIATAISTGLKTCAPTMLMESYGDLSAAVANRLSVFLIVFSVLGMVLAGVFRKKVTSNEMQAICTFIFLAMPFVFMACTVGIWNYWLILALLSGAIIFIQAMTPFSNSYSAARFSGYGRSGTISGILNGSAAFGNVIATYVFPAMAEKMPWSYVVLTWGIGCAVIIVIAICLYKKWTLFIHSKGGK